MSYFFQNNNLKYYFQEYFGTPNTTQKLIVQPFTKVGQYNWTAPEDTTVDYLIVGGGGGGGSAVDNSAGGGGGAGMVISGKMQVTKGKTYKIVVGKGGESGNIIRGTGGPQRKFLRYITKSPGSSGGNSSITTNQGIITALGGVGGDGGSTNVSNRYGKGGDVINGTTKSAQGGGNGTNNIGGGGGGGNISNGESVTTNKSGEGGSGVVSAISGQNVIYGMGGNGGVLNKVEVGKSGTPNSGNGGNGASSFSNKAEPKPEADFVRVKGGNGGSGVVILSYYITEVLAEETQISSSLENIQTVEQPMVEEPVVQEEVREIRNYKLISGKDQYGSTIGEPIINKTVEEVARLCKNTQDCVGFVRDIGTNTCLLKSSWNNVFSNNNKEIYVLNNTEMKEYNYQTNYDLLNNTDKIGFTSLEESGKSPEECLMKCDTINNCVGIVYTPDGKCLYKDNVIDTQNAKDMKLYQKKNISLNNFKMFIGKDVFGGDIGEPIRDKSLKEIADICISTPNCVGFRYDNTLKIAHLKNSFINMYTPRSLSSSTLFVLPNAVVSNIKSGYDITNNMSRTGYNIREDRLINVDQCLLNCNLMDQCTGIVYKSDTKTCNYKENILGGTASDNSELYKKRSSILNEFNFFPGKDKWGADMGNPITNKSIEDVAKICKATPGCVGFVRNITDKTYYLKSDLNGIYNFDPSLREIYALNNIQPTNYDINSMYDMNTNTDRGGYDIGNDQGWNIERCLLKCDSMENCSGVAYVNNNCYYKENIANTYPQNNTNLYKKRSSGLNQYSFIGGKDISQRDNRNRANPANTVGFVSNTSLEICSKNCNNNNNCVGFVWDANTRSCDLKSNLAPTSSDVPGKEMYYKNNNIPQNYSYLPGVERKDADIGKSMRGVSPNDCKVRCDSMSDCRGFIYNTNDSECWMKNDVINKRTYRPDTTLYVKN
jgi:hypothetical protein